MRILPIIFTTCLGLLLSYSSHGQFVYYDQSEPAGEDLIHRLILSGQEVKDSLTNLGYTAERFVIFEVGNKTLMTVDGRFDVYEWKGDHWYNIYIGTFHGYNFNSQKFTFDGKLFSYRGYGFWREHGEIIEFLPKKGEWQIIVGSEVLPFGVGYIKDSVFMVCAEHCFKVDLIRQSAIQTQCEFSIRDGQPLGHVYTLKDYILIVSNLNDGFQNPLIDKNSQQVYLSKRQPFVGLRDTNITNALIHIFNNNMDIILPNGELIKYSIDEELQYYIAAQEAEIINMKWVWLVMILILLCTYIIIRRLSLKKDSRTDEDDILHKFSAYSNQVINSDTLDSILSIDGITVYETKKHKRAALIRDINIMSISKHGKELIVRKKDSSDKRFYLYHIQSL